MIVEINYWKFGLSVISLVFRTRGSGFEITQPYNCKFPCSYGNEYLRLSVYAHVCSYMHPSPTHIHTHTCTHASPHPPPPLPQTHTHRFNMITDEECNALNDLYNYNPLLFDVASKRLLRGPNGEQFPASVFKAHPNLPPYRSREPVEPVLLVPHWQDRNALNSYLWCMWWYT